jgi:hypothetical protein
MSWMSRQAKQVGGCLVWKPGLECVMLFIVIFVMWGLGSGRHHHHHYLDVQSSINDCTYSRGGSSSNIENALFCSLKQCVSCTASMAGLMCVSQSHSRNLQTCSSYSTYM